MKIDALDHPKTLDLAKRLQVLLPQAIGHLELLWAFVAKRAPQGNIGKWADGAIAEAAHWPGDPETFVTALREARFLDRSKAHRMVVHDWSEHMPNWVRAKLKKAGQGVLSANDSGDLSGGTSGDLSTDLSGDSVSLNQGKGSQEKPKATASAQPQAARAPEPVFIELPAIGGMFHVTQDQVRRWSEIYTAVDVEQELRKMLGWLEADKRRLKTKGGVPRFIVNWLSRSQDRPTGASNGAHRQPGKPRGADILDEACADAFARPQTAAARAAH